jgi:hypothetical protein
MPVDVTSTGRGPGPVAPWRPGKGSSRARPKIATMTAIRTRFAYEIVKMDQIM